MKAFAIRCLLIAVMLSASSCSTRDATVTVLPDGRLCLVDDYRVYFGTSVPAAVAGERITGTWKTDESGNGVLTTPDGRELALVFQSDRSQPGTGNVTCTFESTR